MLDADILRAGLAGRPPTGPEMDMYGDGDAADATGAGVPLEVEGLFVDGGREMPPIACDGMLEPVGVC